MANEKHIKYATWNVEDLQSNSDNPRTLSRSRLEDLKRSLKSDPDFLRVRPIIVNVHKNRKGVVIGGNMRLEAAKALGMKQVPVVEVDADEITEKRWLLKDNAHHGEWDDEKLAEIVSLNIDDMETALPSDILDKILNEVGPETTASEEEQIEDVAAGKAITKPGGAIITLEGVHDSL